MATLSPDDITLSAIIAGILLAAIFIAGTLIDAHLLSGLFRQEKTWNDKCQRLRMRPWSGNDSITLLLVVGTVLAAMMLVSQILNQCGIVLSHAGERFLVLGETLLVQGTAIATIEYLRRRNKRTIQECFFGTQISVTHDLKKGALFYIALIPPVIISALLSSFVLQYFGIAVESQDILKSFADPEAPLWFSVYMMGLAVALAPLVEEMVFRGIALPLAAKYTSPAGAIIGVSLLFALIHAHLPALAPLFVVAVGCSLAYIHSGSILVPITMHALFNGINLSIFYLSYDMTPL